MPLKAPKVKAKARAKAGAAAEDDETPAWIHSVNAKHMVELQSALKAINDHPMCLDWNTGGLLKFDQGAQQAQFSQKECTANLQKGTAYKSALPFWWLKLDHSNAPAVPIDDVRVRKIKELFYPGNRMPQTGMPFTVHIAVDSRDARLEQHKGALLFISEEEPIHATIFALHELLLDADMVELEKTAVVNHFLTCLRATPTVIEVIAAGIDRIYKSESHRERRQELARNLKRSTEQRIYFIMGFKHDFEQNNGKVSSEALAKMLERNISPSSNPDEQYKKSIVDSACTIFKMVYSNEVARASARDLERLDS